MVKKYILFFLLVLGIMFLSACQPTPENPVVVSKGDGELQRILSGEPAATLAQPYQRPLNWNETIDGIKERKLIVEVDAVITVPKALSYPVFRVAQAPLSQEAADNFIRYFIGEQKLYDYGERTKSDEHLQAIIDMAEYSLNNPSSPLNTKYTEDIGVKGGAHELVKSSAERFRDLAMAQLAKPKNGKAVTPLFEDVSNGSLDAHFFTYTLDKEIILRESASGRKIMYHLNSMDYLGLMNTYAIAENLTEMRTNINNAKAKASVILHGLGYDDWYLANAGAVEIMEEDFVDVLWDLDNTKINKPQNFWLTYTPPIFEDIPLLYYCNNNWEYSQGQFEMLNNHDNYAPLAGFQPSLHLAIGDDEISYAVLHSAMDILDTVNTNVPLLSFEKIQETFRHYILLQSNLSFDWDRNLGSESDGKLEKTTIRIKDIKLGYMKVREKNGTTDLLLPVWMFYGTQHDNYTTQEPGGWQLDKNGNRIMDTPAGFTFLIINAIDGSIIDPLLGY